MTVDLASAGVAPGQLLSRLDPGLPSLAESFDTKVVAKRFEQEWDTPVDRCTLLRVRYEPLTRCVTTYRLALGRPAARDTVGVIELTPGGATCRDYTEDLSLPGLRVSHAQVVSYHPGERAVVRQERADESHTRTLFAKVLAEGAEVLGATLAMLGEAALLDDTLPAFPTLVEVDDELGVVLQDAMIGEPLHAWVTDGTRSRRQREDAFRLTGAALTRLHRAGTPVSTTATAADDAAALQAYLPAARQADGVLASRMEAAMAKAGTSAAATGVDGGTVVPSHGALRTDQVLLAGGRPGLLDLDGYCGAHPGRDIGNLVAYLRWRSLRNAHDVAAAGQARAAFLDGYRSVAPVPADADLTLFEALSLLKIAGRRFRSLSVQEWPLVPALVDAADALLADGNPR